MSNSFNLITFVSHLCTLTIQIDCSLSSGMSGDFSMSHLSLSKLRGFELNSTAHCGQVKSKQGILLFETNCIISDTTGMKPQLQTETMITCFERSAWLPPKPDCYSTITHRDDGKLSSPQSRARHPLSGHLHCRLSSAFKI